MQPQACKPHCAAAFITRSDGGSTAGRAPPLLSGSDRARLSTAALLRRAGLGGPAKALGRRGWLRNAASRLPGLAGLRLQSVAGA